ncbi:MAG TPA: FGGY-family carbohydrate kinase [Acidimicrobiia bacterium]|nr:FGGY-family carbohydrate kinase [Acidimicrobiia bacterium]
MTADRVLTVDLGTSGPKVAVFTLDGRYLDGDFAPVPTRLVGDLGAEQRPDDWWRGVIDATRRLHDRSSIDPAAVAAVAVTSQWSGTVPIDRDGTPLHDALIWMDARGVDAIREVVGGRVRIAGYDPRKLRAWIQRSGGAPSRAGKDPIAHIHWLERHRPDVARATWKYLEPKDWLNFRLTGRAAATFDSITLHWVTDNRDLLRIDYDDTLLRIAGLRRDQLPDLIGATDVLGGLTDAAAHDLGLRAGTPVIGGTPDLQSAAVGSGAVRELEGHLYVGTSAWLTCHVATKKTDLRRGIATLPSPLPGRYYVADEQESAGACLNWLRDHVLFPDDSLRETPVPADVFQRLDALAEASVPGAHGVIFTPWLNGERTPVDDHTVRGGWHNLTLATTRADLVRSVLEGVAYNSRWLLGCVERFTGRPFPWLHFIGGGAESPLWCQIHADVLQRPIRQVEHPIRANARGAALLAAIALGAMTPDDVARAVPIRHEYTPNPEHRATYDTLYREFRNIYTQTKGIYQRLHAHG